MKNYEQLKQVVQQANPEILELKFGCEVKYQGEKTTVVSSETDFFAHRPNHTMGKAQYMVITPSVHGNNTIYEGDLEVKILGRPIRLADVLLAVQESDNKPMYFNCGSDGAFYEVDYTYPDGNHCVIEHKGLGAGVGWNLRDDNLDNQSEETKEFLIDLLVK